jgi:hypothetical protein
MSAKSLMAVFTIDIHSKSFFSLLKKSGKSFLSKYVGFIK